MHQKVTHEAIVDIVGVGGLFSRQDIARALGRERATTWIITNIEQCVKRGLIERIPATIGNQPGWGYCMPDMLERIIS